MNKSTSVEAAGFGTIRQGSQEESCPPVYQVTGRQTLVRNLGNGHSIVIIMAMTISIYLIMFFHLNVFVFSHLIIAKTGAIYKTTVIIM